MGWGFWDEDFGIGDLGTRGFRLGRCRDAWGGILYGGCGVEGEVGSGLAGMAVRTKDPETHEREGGGKEKRVGNAQAINFKKCLQIPMV